MASTSTSLTGVPGTDETQPSTIEGSSTQDHPGRGPSTIPEDKKTELRENIEDDWQDDPENPRNWPFAKKWTTTSIYHITNATILALTLSIFLISYGIAPLILAPLSEMYGRCAFAPTTGSLMAFRFLSGASGSASLACGGGVISDLFSERDRSAAMALYTLGPLIGPVLGPIMGGFVTETVGIKWVFIIVAGLGARECSWLPLGRETYAPLLRLRKAKMSADPEKAALGHPVLIKEHSSKLHYLWNYLSRPAILLFGSPVCFMLSLMYGIYYLMFTTFDTLFIDTYGFNTGTSGLTYIVGKEKRRQSGARNADSCGDLRIALRSRGVVLVWLVGRGQIHWIMPIIGTAIFGFGMTTTFLPMQLYLVDTFTFAASALSAASVFRSLFGCVFPLFGGPMFAALGIGGGNSLLGGLALVLGIPFPVYLYYHGASIRAKSKLTR
ncbi:multidrug resistance protein 4 [Mycena leptocephala]|nr:multidrug resistance protein 4 [Mycena leptocephala]